MAFLGSSLGALQAGLRIFHGTVEASTFFWNSSTATGSFKRACNCSPQKQCFLFVPLSCFCHLCCCLVPGMRPPGLDEIQRLDMLWFSFFSYVSYHFEPQTTTHVNFMSVPSYGSSAITLTGANAVATNAQINRSLSHTVSSNVYHIMLRCI